MAKRQKKVREEKPMNFMNAATIRRNSVVATLSILFIVAAGAAVYFYVQLQQNPQTRTQAEADRVVARVGNLIVLPEGEQPTVATVSDLQSLKDQAFFANAQIGYKVLIYANARKAILYDPGRNKVVEIAPLNIGKNSGTSEGPEE